MPNINITVINDPNHPGIKLVHALHEAILAAQVDHALALDALLTLYGLLAMHFPCCHDGALAALALHTARIQQAQTDLLMSEQAASELIARAARSTH